MPQMAPLSWTILMLSFILLYTTNTVKMYFTNTYTISPKTNSEKMTTKKFNWKW